MSGHHWGGAVAVKMANKYPERVSHLVLASPAVYDENIGNKPTHIYFLA